MLLIDHVLPSVPYRHITFTFPGPLAVRLGYDRKLLAKVLLSLGTRFDQNLRRRLKRHYNLKSVSHLHPGSLAVVQRFRFDLGLYVHVHSLSMDGAFLCDHEYPCGGVHPFYAAPAWSSSDLADIVRRIDADIRQILERADDDASEHEAIRACLTIGHDRRTDPLVRTESCGQGLLAAGEYVAIHVASPFDGRDRKRLERQVKYMLRPPVALDDVTATNDGTIRIALKRPTARGAWFTELTPRQLLARLAALVPPPFANVLRYRGVFSARHHLRPHIIQRAADALTDPDQLALFRRKGQVEVVAVVSKQPPTPSRVSWARLLARVFSADLSTCPLCAGPMKVLDAVVEPSRIAQMLTSHAGAGRGLGDSGDAPSADASRPRNSEPTEAGDATNFSGRTSRGPPPVGQLKLFN